MKQILAQHVMLTMAQLERVQVVIEQRKKEKIGTVI